MASQAASKPIMVSFGTNQGPIVPRQPKSTSAQERSATTVSRNPAPVSEEREDVPNPYQYRPLIPHQYRTKLYSFKPQTNLILGTPLDVKFTPSLQKYNLRKKDIGRSLKLGVDYTGPHIFEKQDYEVYNLKTTLQPSRRYSKPHYYQVIDKKTDGSDNKFVPQIGIVYSSGVRYYIPQIVYYNPQSKAQALEENSVYDINDNKYYH